MKKTTILIIDDEKIITESLNLLITESFNFNVIECNDPLEALSILRKNQPFFSFMKNNIDCIICDIKMPGLNGIDLMKTWRKEEKGHIPVILLSAYEDISKWFEATHPHDLYATSYLKKPIVNEDILSTLHKIINEKKTAELMEDTRKKSYDKYMALKNEKEMKSAKEIQMSILPKTLPEIEGLSIQSYFQSANSIGGDFYDLIKSKDKLAVIVIDIIGKGIPACLLMGRIREIFFRYFDINTSPKELIATLNTVIYNDPTLQKGIPAFYGIFDIIRKEFTYVNTLGNAGCAMYSNGKVRLLNSGGFMLGATTEEVYEQESIPFNQGDTFSFFTDGITEQQNKSGNPLDIEGLSELIKNANQSKNAEDNFHTLLLQAFQFFHYGAEQDDDITLVNIEVTK